MPDRAVPNLPSRDFDTTVAFYRGFGFEVEYRDGGWLILRRGGVQLEFFLAPEIDPYASWSMCSIRIEDLDEMYAAIRRGGVPERTTGIPRLVPIALQEWGHRAGFLIDVDGTQLHLIEDAAQPRHRRGGGTGSAEPGGADELAAAQDAFPHGSVRHVAHPDHGLPY
ncbi:bleomycin resistance protein [Planococcus sp. APC 4015]|nr:bleomycin resistance protein [Planococcus sp. APC 4015]